MKPEVVYSGLGGSVPTSGTPLMASITRVLKFGFVGGVGFVVDAVVTIGLVWLGLGPFSARMFAIPTAMLATYLLNRALTFRGQGATGASAVLIESLRYVAVALVAAATNWLIYAAALIAAPDLSPLVALTIGSIVAMSVSYLGYSRYAFRHR